MARKELLRVLSKTMCLLVLANADFSLAVIRDCVDYDLAHLDEYVPATFDISSVQGNRSGLAKDGTGSLGAFGTLETDWIRLSLLRDALPEDSILKRKFNHIHRVLLTAHEQASMSRFREFAASVTESTVPDIVEDDEAARITTATTEWKKSTRQEENNGTAVSSYHDAGFASSATTLDTSPSTRGVDNRSLVTSVNRNILDAEIINETITRSSSQENTTPVSLGLTSTTVSTSSLKTPNETGYSPDGESQENPYGDSMTTRSQSSTPSRMDKIIFESTSQKASISSTPLFRAEYSSTPIFVTSPYVKDPVTASANVEVLDAKTHRLIVTQGWSRVPIGNVALETTIFQSTSTVHSTPIPIPMSMSGDESSSASTITRTPETTKLPISMDEIKVVAKAEAALSNETQTRRTLNADDQVDRLGTIHPTNTGNDRIKTSHENQMKIHLGELSVSSKWDGLANTSTMDNIGQSFERESAEQTELGKIDAQETVVQPPMTSQTTKAKGSTTNSMDLDLPTSTSKNLEKKSTIVTLSQRENSSQIRYNLVEDHSTLVQYTSSATTRQHIRNPTPPNFQKNALPKSSSRIREISRDYKHEPIGQLGGTRDKVQPDSSLGLIYELGVSAKNRTIWRQHLDQQSPCKKNIEILPGALQESTPPTISPPGAYWKQKRSGTTSNLHIPDESSTQSSLLGRTNKLTPPRRGISADIGKRFRSFYVQGQFEVQKGSR